MQKQSLDHYKRPWGEFQVIDSGDGFQVKRIIVLPGKRLPCKVINLEKNIG